MSSIVTFFAARDERAADALTHDPDASSRALSFGNFDAEEALLDWQARLTGVSFESLVERDLPEVVAENDAGAAVFLLSDALVEALAAATDPEVRALASWWAEEKSADGIAIEPDAAALILRSLADLARAEREPGTHVYCRAS
ncbi:hypothetical protein HII36_03240 [Nonomuraea sp. NN258]|uniref:hypothetical protein n=1 Tax=Nonomuraea antri TaxID=2730852 RepID=UPI00156A1C81|nr:hypothetical protein [Nonomuraea antri]NRQ30854.1 hypothetical protein [Nonomuraea antri]